MFRGKRPVCGDRFRGKKERSRELNKTVSINVAFILSNTAGKIPE
jgi:hypothetical protein